LERDAKDAGGIVAKTRQEIEGQTGHGVIESGNAKAWWMGTRRASGRISTVKGVTEGAHRPGADAPVQAETSPDAVVPNEQPAADKAVA
jgi:hypothetical protein